MGPDGVVLFEECFEQVEDPRVVGRTTHSLHSILFIAVAATVAGSSRAAATTRCKSKAISQHCTPPSDKSKGSGLIDWSLTCR